MTASKVSPRWRSDFSSSKQSALVKSIQLMAFRSLQRHNDAGQMMRNIAARLSDQDMKAVASYIEGLRE